MATGTNGIATEGEAKSKLGYTGSVDTNKCCTKARAVAMGADSSKLTSYKDNQLVKYSDISKVAFYVTLNIPLRYTGSQTSKNFIVYLKNTTNALDILSYGNSERKKMLSQGAAFSIGLGSGSRTTTVRTTSKNMVTGTGNAIFLCAVNYMNTIQVMPADKISIYTFVADSTYLNWSNQKLITSYDSIKGDFTMPEITLA